MSELKIKDFSKNSLIYGEYISKNLCDCDEDKYIVTECIEYV